MESILPKESYSSWLRKDLQFCQDPAPRAEGKGRGGGEAKFQLLQLQRMEDLKMILSNLQKKKSAVLRGKSVQFYLILSLAEAGSEG